MRYDYDFDTLWAAKMLIKDVIEAVEKHCDKDDDGGYIVLIGNEDYEHDRTWIHADDIELLKKFIEAVWLRRFTPPTNLNFTIMTKKELIKLIPDHGKFVCDRAESKQLNNVLVLLHAVQRDGKQIWVDVEYPDGFGRWLTPFEDLSKEARKYVYESVERTLRFNREA